MDQGDTDGTLVVVVLKARNLQDKHFYKQDVYAVVSLDGTSEKTPVDVKGGQHPLWDHELRFPVKKSIAEKARTLQIVCWSKEPRVDEVIASGKLAIGETLKTGEFDDWVPLVEPTGAQRGDVYLEMTFFSNAPPPPVTQQTKVQAPKKPIPGPHFSPHIVKDMHAPLQRRPTKLQPAERMSRVPAALVPNKPQRSNADNNRLQPPGTGRGGAPPTPPKGRASSHSPPKTTAQLQDLHPRTHYQRHSGPPTPVPSTLRPGPAGSSAHNASKPPFASHEASCSPSHQGLQYPNTNLMNPYTSPAPPSSTPAPYIPQPTPQPSQHSHYTYPTPPISHTPSPYPPSSSYYPPSDPGFPRANTPSVSLFPEPAINQVNATGYPGTNGGPPGSNLPDPYLIARYQTPLPLPPGQTPSPASAPTPAMPSYTTPNFPSASVPSASTNTYSHHSPRGSVDSPWQADAAGTTRLDAQRREEEALRMKKEQEERDMELARQLDRELNL